MAYSGWKGLTDDEVRAQLAQLSDEETNNFSEESDDSEVFHSDNDCEGALVSESFLLSEDEAEDEDEDEDLNSYLSDYRDNAHLQQGQNDFESEENHMEVDD